MSVADWKQKYSEAIRALVDEENRARNVEQALRRIVGRLCTTASGQAPELDVPLERLAAANRRNADAAEMEKLLEELRLAVAALDAAKAKRAADSSPAAASASGETGQSAVAGAPPSAPGRWSA
ncbi:MAG: hypothetical protein NZM12_01530, partial [Steroidobacteraceae bacterium]|nr:hypothetical protein [Steroidobacteraceae bacterium]MDW8257806.1 hypothetical protein [Gammaproteobacteria bacterium]